MGSVQISLFYNSVGRSQISNGKGRSKAIFVLTFSCCRRWRNDFHLLVIFEFMLISSVCGSSKSIYSQFAVKESQSVTEQSAPVRALSVSLPSSTTCRIFCPIMWICVANMRWHSQPWRTWASDVWEEWWEEIRKFSLFNYDSWCNSRSST